MGNFCELQMLPPDEHTPSDLVCRQAGYPQSSLLAGSSPAQLLAAGGGQCPGSAAGLSGPQPWRVMCAVPPGRQDSQSAAPVGDDASA